MSMTLRSWQVTFSLTQSQTKCQGLAPNLRITWIFRAIHTLARGLIPLWALGASIHGHVVTPNSNWSCWLKWVARNRVKFEHLALYRRLELHSSSATIVLATDVNLSHQMGRPGSQEILKLTISAVLGSLPPHWYSWQRSAITDLFLSEILLRLRCRTWLSLGSWLRRSLKFARSRHARLLPSILEAGKRLYASYERCSASLWLVAVE